MSGEQKEQKEQKEVKTCLICKPAGDLSKEEIPHWSKKEGNYSPYPKMITCDAKYALEQREDMVEEKPQIKDKAIELEMGFGEGSAEKWVFYFASKEQEDPLTINPPGEAYGQDENRGLLKTDKSGKVTFVLNCPQPYRAEGTTYCRHVHYLVEGDGVWQSMRTTRVICEIDLEKLDKVIKEKTALVINALDFKDYDKDKIPGSINLPASELNDLGSEEKERKVVDFLKEKISGVKQLEEKVKGNTLDIKDVPIVTYCAKKQCKTSQKLLDHFYECGVNNVLEFSGGMELWNKERTFFGVDSDEEEEEEDEDLDKESSDDSDSSSSDSDDSDDSDSDDSDSDDSESDDAIEVEYQGVKYLYDKENKELCNDEADILAKADYEDGKIKDVKWLQGEEKKHKENSDYKEPITTSEKEEEEEEAETSSEEESSDDEEEDEDEEDEEDDDDQLPKPSKKQKRVQMIDSDSEEYEESDKQAKGAETKKKSKDKPKKLTAKSKKTIQQWEKILKEKGISYHKKNEEEEEEGSTETFNFGDEELRGKKVKELKDLVIKMTERKGGTYGFPLGRKGYRTKGQIINLIQTCQGKSASKNSEFDYLDEDDLYTMKIKDLKDHVQDMITREKGSYKFALSNFKKDGLIELVMACQGDPKQSGGGGKKYKGYGWGFMF